MRIVRWKIDLKGESGRRRGCSGGGRGGGGAGRKTDRTEDAAVEQYRIQQTLCIGCMPNMSIGLPVNNLPLLLQTLKLCNPLLQHCRGWLDVANHLICSC